MRISAVRPRSTVMATPSAMADVGQIALRRPAVPAMRQSWFDATWQALWPRGCHHSEASGRPSRECGGNSPLGLGSLRKICQLWSLRRSELSAHRPSTQAWKTCGQDIVVSGRAKNASSSAMTRPTSSLAAIPDDVSALAKAGSITAQNGDPGCSPTPNSPRPLHATPPVINSATDPTGNFTEPSRAKIADDGSFIPTLRSGT